MSSSHKNANDDLIGQNEAKEMKTMKNADTSFPKNSLDSNSNAIVDHNVEEITLNSHYSQTPSKSPKNNNAKDSQTKDNNETIELNSIEINSNSRSTPSKTTPSKQSLENSMTTIDVDSKSPKVQSETIKQEVCFAIYSCLRLFLN